MDQNDQISPDLANEKQGAKSIIYRDQLCTTPCDHASPSVDMDTATQTSECLVCFLALFAWP
jgi:hypothetical protein